MQAVEMPEIIRGITEFDEGVHVSTGRYPALGEGVEVVEVMHAYKLAHLGDRWPVFTRLISKELLEQRRLDYSSDPEAFKEEHLRNL